jgi:hypothetical protein
MSSGTYFAPLYYLLHLFEDYSTVIAVMARGLLTDNFQTPLTVPALLWILLYSNGLISALPGNSSVNTVQHTTV